MYHNYKCIEKVNLKSIVIACKNFFFSGKILDFMYLFVKKVVIMYDTYNIIQIGIIQTYVQNQTKKNKISKEKTF